jgi:nucleoid DNA-binding protein
MPFKNQPPRSNEPRFDKKDLLNFLEAVGLTKAEAKRAFDAVFIAITAALHSHEEVEVRGFGRFYFRKVCTDIGSHETKWRVAFRPAYIFKKLLADNQEAGEWFERRYVRGRRTAVNGH